MCRGQNDYDGIRERKSSSLFVFRRKHWLEKIPSTFSDPLQVSYYFLPFFPSKQPSVRAEALEKESHPLPKTAKKKSLQQQAAAGYEARAASMVVVACSLEKAFA